MGLLGPMDESVSKKHEAQEGANGMELARAQVLDVIDMARLTEERLNRLTFIVETETALDAELVGRQVGIHQEVFEVPFRQVEFVQQTALAIQGFKFHPLHQVIHGIQSCSGTCSASFRARRVSCALSRK